MSVRAVEKRLGHGRGYVSDALRAEKKLGLEVILEVLAAIRVSPEEFFEQPTVPTRRAGHKASVPPPERTVAGKATPRDARAIADALLLLLAERGVLSSEQLAEFQRELASGESTLTAVRRAR